MTIVSYKSGQFAVKNKSKFKFTILKYPLNFSIRILEKMKILYLLDFQPFEEDLSGATKVIYHTIKEQSTKNQVDVLLINQRSKKIPEHFFGVQHIWEDLLPIQPPKPYLIQPFPEYELQQLKILANRYQFNSYDIIHTSVTMRNLGLLHPAVIYSLHDSFSLAIRSDFKIRNLIRKFYWKLYERTHKSRGCWVTFVSARDAAQYNSNIKKVVLVNGLDHSKYKPVDQKKIANSFVFHGVLDYEPNLETIAYTSKLLAATNPSSKLYLVGRLNRISKPDFGKILLPLTNCTYIGEVANISEEISKYQYYILLMQSGSGIKNKLLEAMATGCTIITNRKSILGLIKPEELLKGIYLLEDYPSLSVLLDAIGNDIANAKSNFKREIARAYIINNYSWQSYSDQLTQTYQQMLNYSRS